MAAEFIERRIQSNGQTVNFNIDRKQPYLDTIIDGKKARVYGTQSQLDEYQTKKPDGTKISQITKIPAAIGKGVAKKLLETNKAVNPIENGKSTVEVDTKSTSGSQGQNLRNLVPNPLLNFASYTPLWTLAVLTPQQFNNPTSYRTDDLSFAGQTYNVQNVIDSGSGDGVITQTRTLQSGIVFSSGGRDYSPEGSISQSSRVSTAYGRPEFYVDNFKMAATVSASQATGNSNAVGFEFEIYEPYSMGLLLQSMQAAAINAGYANYLNNAAFLLRLDFKGFTQNGKVLSSVKPKFFPMKLTEVKFEVDESGSKYMVKAIPYNHSALSDNVDLTFKDIKISAPNENTVEEMLVKGENSLAKILKKAEEENVKNQQYSIEDIYEIQFPETSDGFVRHTSQTNTDKGATTSSRKPPKSVGKSTPISKEEFGENKIGKATFNYGADTGGNFDFSKKAMSIIKKLDWWKEIR